MFIWDHRNRLTAVERFDDQDTLLASVAYVYDFANRLVQRSLDADGAGNDPAVVENYVYDGDQIILRLDESQEVLNRYLWGPAVDRVLADEDAADETVRWALGDHQNTVRDLAEFDDNGTPSDTSDDSTIIVDHRTYSAFGVTSYDSSSTVATLFGYTGRLFDAAFGIQYNTNRWVLTCP